MKWWSWTHKWSSLLATVFLLVSCITGLPLIFHHEIEDASRTYRVEHLPPGATHVGIDSIIAAAKAGHPGKVVQFLVTDADQGDTVSVTLGNAPDDDDGSLQVIVDTRTGRVLGEPDHRSGLMFVLLGLHTELFAGLAGSLVLGVVGLLFVLSLVSGIVVYGPFMRRLPFGTVRRRERRLRWLDLHNLLGIATVAWALVVATTGAVNTLAEPAIALWQSDQLAAVAGRYRNAPLVPQTDLASAQAAVTRGLSAAPGMELSLIAFPGTRYATPSHYTVFARGDTPLTRRLLTPVWVDARTNEIADTRPLPLYLTSILVSQPLHFGDYGGLPLKVLWALLDLVTIAILGSGIYLWVTKHRAAAGGTTISVASDPLASSGNMTDERT